MWIRTRIQCGETGALARPPVPWPGGDARRSTDKVGLVRFLLFVLASTRFPFSLI